MPFQKPRAARSRRELVSHICPPYPGPQWPSASAAVTPVASGAGAAVPGSRAFGSGVGSGGSTWGPTTPRRASPTPGCSWSGRRAGWSPPRPAPGSRRSATGGTEASRPIRRPGPTRCTSTGPGSTIRRYFGAVPVSRLGQRQVREFVAALLDAGLRPATVAGVYAALRSVLVHAQEQGEIEQLPVPARSPVPRPVGRSGGPGARRPDPGLRPHLQRAETRSGRSAC